MANAYASSDAFRTFRGAAKKKIEVLSATLENRPVLANLIELYRQDISQFDGREIGEHGLYGYRYLDHYWTEPGRHPFLNHVDGQLAGFDLVSIPDLNDAPKAHVSKFFVMRKYRGMGVGEAIAHDVFRRFPGHWQVSQAAKNIAAQRFWRTVIGRFTRGVFTEEHDEVGRTVLEFRYTAGVGQRFSRQHRYVAAPANARRR